VETKLCHEKSESKEMSRQSDDLMSGSVPEGRRGGVHTTVNKFLLAEHGALIR